jgi:hypothetical protein
MPASSSVLRWLATQPEFREKYARAREVQMDAMAEEIIAIADDTSLDLEFDEKGDPRANHEFIQRSRLRVDARKWLMAKLAPRKYGDKQHLEVSSDTSLAEAIFRARQRRDSEARA